MMKLFSSRIFVHHVAMDESGQIFRDFQKLTRDSMTFVTSELKFLKPLYDLSILHKPLLVKVVGGHIGNTSLNAITIVSLESSDTELMSNINQVVYIDPSTRKPTPLPNWWTEKYAEFAIDKSSLMLHHANWTSYAQYAIDAAHLCSKQGSLKYFYISMYYVFPLTCIIRGKSLYSLQGENLFMYNIQNIESLTVHSLKEVRLLLASSNHTKLPPQRAKQ